MVEAGGDHAPRRPSWECRACDHPWPCDPAREHLMGTSNRVELATSAWERLSEAVEDMPTAPPRELFERFVAWTRTSYGR